MNLKDKISEIIDDYRDVPTISSETITEKILDAVHDSLNKDKRKWNKFRVGGDV